MKTAVRIEFFGRGDALAQRKTIPANGGYDIAVATEQMRDGNWAALATVTQSTGTAHRNVDLPVTKERFATEADAENFAVRMAKEWIEKNIPSELGAFLIEYGLEDVDRRAHRDSI